MLPRILSSLLLLVASTAATAHPQLRYNRADFPPCDSFNHGVQITILDPANSSDCSVGLGIEFDPLPCWCDWDSVSMTGEWKPLEVLSELGPLAYVTPPLSVADGGTGSGVADEALANLGIENFEDLTVAEGGDLAANSLDLAVPLPTAEGGTGSSTVAGARQNLQVPQFLALNSPGILSTPPVSPSTGDTYLVGDAPSGVWSSLENEVVEWSGSAWSTISTAIGDYVTGSWDSRLPGVQVAFRSVAPGGGGLGDGGIWPNSAWSLFQRTPPADILDNSAAIDANTTLSFDDRFETFVVNSVSDITITLPNMVDDDLRPGDWFRLLRTANVGEVTVNVDGTGGFINGASSVILPEGYHAVTFHAVDFSGLGALQYFTSTAPNLGSWVSDGDVILDLQADADNSGESDNPYIRLSQDAEVNEAIVGLSGNADQDPKAATLTGADANSLILQSDNSIHFALGSDLAASVRTGEVEIEDSLLHINQGGAAFTPFSGTGLLIQNNASTSDGGIVTILGGNASSSQLVFGDVDSEFIGRVLYNHVNNSMVLRTNGSDNLTLDSSGNVTISGEITTSSGTSPFPDYVFADDYDLMPLSELSEFIDEHRRLPKIPSAESVEASGKVNLTAMQILLLEKIEELTLYAVQQQRQIDDLRSWIESGSVRASDR